MTTESDTANRREELRGIFILGLLAVLVVIRYQNEPLMVQIGQSSFDFIPWLNLTIILWSLYAFFMIFGLSDDAIGKNLAEMFRNISIIFLRLDFIWSAFIGTLYFFVGYFPRSLWIIGFIVGIILIAILLSLGKTKPREIWKRPKMTKLDLLEWAASVSLIIFVAELFLYPDELYLIVFFVLGLGSYIAFTLVHEKQAKEKSKSD